MYTAQRQGDLIKMTAAQIEPLNIYDPAIVKRVGNAQGVVMGWMLDQGKTETPMQIALEPAILAKVNGAVRTNRARDRAATPKRLLTYVLVDDATGKPWKKRAFYDAYRAVIENAATATGRPHMLDLTWHDLRRTRVVRLRRRGIRLETIADLTGHSLQSIQMMLKVYGPIDATSTAAAIVSGMAPEPDRSVKTPKTTRKRNRTEKIIVLKQR